ncbi:MAG: hypothetical protein SPF70_04975 [Lachnospiraceae bacterium]|nr:hypothetical protein [Lachnospiraceae bacterium]
MKLTDFALVFVLCVWCVFSNISFQNDLLQEHIFGTMMYNNIMDNVIEDALEKSVSFDMAGFTIDRDKIVEEIALERGKFMGEDESYARYQKIRIQLIVLTYPDGFYLAGGKDINTFGEKEKIFYSEGNVTPKETKVKEILEASNEKYHLNMLLPEGKSTGLVNTVEDYQLLVIYETYPVTFKGKSYGKLLLSGAKVKK